MNLQHYLQLVNQHDISVYDVISASNLQEAQTEFLANLELSRPNFQYEGPKNLPLHKLRNNLTALKQINGQIAEDPALSAAERQLLAFCVKGACDKNSLAAGTERYRKARSESGRICAGDRLRQYNVQCYGKDGQIPINHDTALAMIKHFMSQINPHELSHKADHQIYDQLVAGLWDVRWQHAQPEQIYHPSTDTMQRFAELVEEHFAYILRYLPEQAEFSAQEVCDLLNEILRTQFICQTKFKAVVDSQRTALSVDQITRTIYVPEKRSGGAYTHKVVKSIVLGHEFCTHAYRGIPYENSGIIPFSQGLPGYEDFDEGLAKCVEQTLCGEYRPAGYEHYINIALAEFHFKDFRQIYNISLGLSFLSRHRPDETEVEHQQRLEKAQTLAFSRTHRALRGTGQLPYFKDLTYFNSTALVWQYIEQRLNDPNFNATDLMTDLFESGKTDISNFRHHNLLEKYRNGEFG